MIPEQVSIQFRLKVVALFVFFFTVGYGFTNRFPVFTPQLLPMTSVDHFFGFHPWTVWVYMSDYILIFLPVVLVTKISVMKHILKGFLYNFAIHFPIFFFFPTTMIRPPLLEENFTNWAFNILRLMDTPVNCFPSQHVSLCFVVAMGFWNYQRKLAIFFYCWAILISLSTLTTKQHYFWDVLGGVLVAALIYIFVYRKGIKDKITLGGLQA